MAAKELLGEARHSEICRRLNDAHSWIATAAVHIAEALAKLNLQKKDLEAARRRGITNPEVKLLDAKLSVRDVLLHACGGLIVGLDHRERMRDALEQTLRRAPHIEDAVPQLLMSFDKATQRVHDMHAARMERKEEKESNSRKKQKERALREARKTRDADVETPPGVGPRTLKKAEEFEVEQYSSARSVAQQAFSFPRILSADELKNGVV